MQDYNRQALPGSLNKQAPFQTKFIHVCITEIKFYIIPLLSNVEEDGQNGYHRMLARIEEMNRYRGLLSLQEEISKMHGKYPFSVYANIKGRLSEKLRVFEDPNCAEVGLKILFMNGSRINVEEADCINARERGMKLPNYLYIKYPNAVDFEIPSGPIKGQISHAEAVPEGDESKKTKDFYIAVDVFKSRVEYMIRLVDRMEALYAGMIPAIVDIIREIGKNLRELYRRLVALRA